jgi:ABC-type transport system involved in multi-copper enzyme maturation permease subunit
VIQYTAMFIAIVLSMYMIPNEIERRTIYVILSKPVTRWQFLLGKYFGAVFAIGLMMALMTIVSLVVFAVNQGGDVSRMATLSQGPVLFFIQMCLLAAVTIFFSTFVAPLVNFFLSIGIYLMGTSLSSLYDSYVKNPEITGPVRFLAETITLALPNFDKYNIANPIIHPGQVIQNPMTYYVNVTGYGIIYIAGLLIAGILIFDRREV